MNIFKRIKNKFATSSFSREVLLTRFSIIIVVVIVLFAASSVLLRPKVAVPANYSIQGNRGYESEAIDIIYSVEFDKYYVFIKYGANRDFDRLKEEVAEALTDFADIEDVSAITVEYIDDRGLQADPHEEEAGGNPIPLTEEDQ